MSLPGRLQLEEADASDAAAEATPQWLSAVRLAHDRVSGAKVAVERFARALDAEERRRFVESAERLAAFSHPGLPVLHGYGFDARTPFLVREHVPGISLRQRLDEGRLSLEELASVFGPVAETLAALHAEGIFHGGLRPELVILREGGPPALLGTAQITVLAADQAPAYLAPAYLAPEQAIGSTRVGAPADVWALGVMIHEALSGASVFQFEELPSARELLLLVCRAEPVSLRARVRGLPAALCEQLDDAVRRAPGERPSAVRLVEALRDATLEPSSLELLDGAPAADAVAALRFAAPEAGVKEVRALRAALGEELLLSLERALAFDEDDEGATVVDLRAAQAGAEVAEEGPRGSELERGYVDLRARRDARAPSKARRRAAGTLLALGLVLTGGVLAWRDARAPSERATERDTTDVAGSGHSVSSRAGLAARGANVEAEGTRAPTPAAGSSRLAAEPAAARASTSDGLGLGSMSAPPRGVEAAPGDVGGPAPFERAAGERTPHGAASADQALLEPASLAGPRVERLHRRAVLSTGAVLSVEQFPAALDPSSGAGADLVEWESGEASELR